MLLFEILAKTGLILSLAGFAILSLGFICAMMRLLIQRLAESWQSRDYADCFVVMYAMLAVIAFFSWMGVESCEKAKVDHFDRTCLEANLGH